MNKKILITGGLGHIGSYLARKLTDDGYLVTILDNFLTNRYCSLFDFNKPITFVEDSIENLGVDFLKQFDVVYHSAAVVNAADSFLNKDQIEKVNVKQTKNLIDNCLEARVPQFIFPSSTSVYGIADDIVFEDNPKFINPQSPYAEAKIEIENYLKENSNNYTIFRFGTIHGVSVGMRFQTAVNKFCYQASLGIPLTVWEDNYEMKRPYLSLIDAYQAIIHSMVKSGTFITANKFLGETFNVVTGNYTLKDIIYFISLYSPHKVEIGWVKTPLLNQYNYTVSFSKIQNFGFVPVGDIQEDIKNTMILLRNLK